MPISSARDAFASKIGGMSDQVVYWLTLACAIGCGLNGGVFFAFSTFVMRALARLPTAQGIAAMQSINVVAVSPWFMLALFGTALLCVILVAASFSSWNRPGAAFATLGGALYLGGTIFVTMACNVPRNNALAKASAQSSQSETVWRTYVTEWTAWNHVRTASALVAAVSFTLAL